MLKAIIIVTDIICAALYLVWGVEWAGSVVIFTFALALIFRIGQVIWGVGERISGTAPDQIAMRRIGDLVAKALDGDRDR
jgi:hypothetical protein